MIFPKNLKSPLSFVQNFNRGFLFQKLKFPSKSRLKHFPLFLLAEFSNPAKLSILHFMLLKRINSLSCLLRIDLNPFFFGKGENYHKIAMNFLTLMGKQIFLILWTLFSAKLQTQKKINRFLTWRFSSTWKFISAEKSLCW